MANSNTQNSSHPKEQGQVKILTPEERENFKGITINAGEREQSNHDYYEYEYRDPQKRVYVRHAKLNSAVINWLMLGLLIPVIAFLVLPFFFFLIIPMIPIFAAILLGNMRRR